MPTTDRIIDIAEGPVALRYDNRLLVISQPDKSTTSIPIDDIGVLILSTPQVTFTQPAIAELAAAGVCTVFCDRTHMPAAMCLPFGVHHQPAALFRAQADAPKPLLKRCWQQVVKSKIQHQAALLNYLHHESCGLDALAADVLSGDTGNHEAIAAKRYWSRLFDGQPFVRDRDAADANALLNYGYTILRAITARAICSTGLHPGLGIHHHNRSNSFCLADDLMEPYRIYVDYAVYILTTRNTPPPTELTKDIKAQIIRHMLQRRLKIEGRRETIFYSITRLASSLANCFDGTADKLRLPAPTFD